MKYLNYNKIATSQSRKKLLELAEYAIDNGHPEKVVSSLFKYSKDKINIKNKEYLTKNKRIFVIGAGKASGGMAKEIEKIIGANNITDGVIITNSFEKKLKKIKIHIADHPIPSERGVRGAKKIFDLKKKYKIDENDIVIALVSGGGSALMPFPVPGISLKDKMRMYDLFIKYAVTGHESTIIKTKISRVKGGGVARHFFPAQIISLILSDDNGGAGDAFTASGPFTNHHSTFKDALDVIDKHKIRNKVPKKILSYLEKGKTRIEKKYNFDHVFQVVLVNNKKLVSLISNKAKRDGIKTIAKSNIEGETKMIAKKFSKEIKKTKNKKPTILIYGGETAVTLGEKYGKGGRNQEFVIACLKHLKEYKNNWALISIATDGKDFIKESAGGIIDQETIKLVEKKKINIDSFLNNHNSNNLLKILKSDIITGLTGTNVGDIMMCLLNFKKYETKK